jgi:glycosyltransferase
MIVIGIPTYNESDNISILTRKIDRVANNIGLEVIIVNADSASTDDTANTFMSTPTKSKKVSIQNSMKGKGRNIYSILYYTADSKDTEGCILIDGDITSFDESWLVNQAEMIRKGYDYIIPTYARNYQEGNTTNHFAYPLLGMHFNGVAPRQPIAGDFGVSAHLARHMTKQRWHDYAYGYGIDIFLTLHALCGSFKCTEISLGKKLHKPSFGKMIPMFREVAASYYGTAQELFHNEVIHSISLDQVDTPKLIQAQSLPVDTIAGRKLEAMNIYVDIESLITTTLSPLTRVTKELWVDVLIAHERMAGQVEPRRIAESILPWYLMRAVTYLEDNSNADEATDEVQQQFTLAMRQWNHEASHH